MIGFELTEDQASIQELAHTFAEQEIRPVAAELDENEEFPWALVKKAGELGLTTFAFPEEMGGLGITDELTNCIITEELAWGWAGCGNRSRRYASSQHSYLAGWDRRTEAAAPQAHCRAEWPLCHGANRTRRRLGCCRDHDHRSP